MTDAKQKKEEKPALAFIATRVVNNEVVAILADRNKLGDSGVESLHAASVSHKFNTLSAREGVHFMSAKQLETRAEDLDKAGMDVSAKELRRANAFITRRKEIEAGKPQAAALGARA
jgi:hypothetical protein